MRMTLRLLLAAAAIGGASLLSATPSSAAAPVAAYQEVAQAGDPAPTAATPRRTRRHRATQARRHTTPRVAARRARTQTPRQG